MILFLLNVFLFSSAFGNTEDIIRVNIKKTDLYRPGRILADPISKFGFIAELIPDLYEGADSKLDLSVTELRKHYLYLGHLFFLAKEGIADINFIPTAISKEFASLLGFYVTTGLINPIRLYPNLASLNARFNLLKDAARNIYKIPGSENIADIFFYPSLKKDSSSLEYLRQVAQGGYPITTFLDGGGILAFHDLFHILHLILPHSLLKGYSDFTKDFLVFLEFISYETLSNKLTNTMARMIDSELANFVDSFLDGDKTAFHNTLDEGIYRDNPKFHDVFESHLRKYFISQEEIFKTLLSKFINSKNSGQPSGGITCSSAHAPNSFIERMNYLFTVVIYDSEEQEVYLKHTLERFVKSPYGVEHNLKDKVYSVNGFELFKETLDHSFFLKTLGKHKGIKQLLAFPEY